MIYMQQKHVIMTTKQVYSHASTSTDSAFDKLVEDSVMSMKAIYCMVVKDAAKLSLQICRNTLLTT